MNKLKAAKSLQKPPPIVGKNQVTETVDCQFELELCWCVQQLEIALNSAKLNKKSEEDAVKNLKILKSSTAPLIKKRQVMQAAFGDYRSKMKTEEKKLAFGAKQIKFTPQTHANTKSSFVKKSAFLNSGKDFRFNFTSNVEQAETDNKFLEIPETREKAKLTQKTHSNEEFKYVPSSGFKFNFEVKDDNEDFNINALSIGK